MVRTNADLFFHLKNCHFLKFNSLRFLCSLISLIFFWGGAGGNYVDYTRSSVLAWRIPGTAEPGGLLSMGSHRVGHD